MMPKQRRLRDGGELGDDEIVAERVVSSTPEVLRTGAQDYRAVYGIYGLSVIAAPDISVDELAQLPPLVRFGVLTLMRVGVLLPLGSGLTRQIETRGTSRSGSTTWSRASQTFALASTSAGSTPAMRTDSHG